MAKKTDSKRNYIVHDWRHFFTQEELDQGEKLVKDGRCNNFYTDGISAQAMIGSGSAANMPRIRLAPISYTTPWKDDWFDCTCSQFTGRGYGYRRFYIPERHCSHTAALMLLWEKQHGPWGFEESDEELQERLRREEEERERVRLEKIRVTEETKRKVQKDREGDRVFPVSKFLEENGGYGENLFFDLKKTAFSVKTNLYAVNRAQKLLEHNADQNVECYIIYGNDGSQQLKAEMEVEDEIIKDRRHFVSMVISRTAVERKECECEPRRIFYGFSRTPLVQPEELCEHELVLLSRINDYVNEKNPGDATDKAAIEFFKALEEAPVVQEGVPAVEKTKRKDVFLSPLISVEKGQTFLSFRLGINGSKPLILKKLSDFSDAYEHEQLYTLGRNLTVNFAEQDFEDGSRQWLNFVMQKVDDADKVNNRISSRYYYYGAHVSVQNKEALEGAVLDRFYDLAEGGVCEMSDKARKSGTYNIAVGHKAMKVSVSTKKITDSSGEIIGVELSGRMPVMLKGTTESYILDEHALSRISKEEERALIPFRSASDTAGNINFRVGKEKLAEYYYRVVPALIEQSYVDLQDDLSEAVAPMLPPEPEFTFYMDMPDDNITCKAVVSYGGKEYVLGKAGKRGDGYRDVSQEERVIRSIEKYFAGVDRTKGLFCSLSNSDDVYKLLAEGVPELSRFGKVMGSERFDGLKIKSSPQFKLNVSIDSGVMDLELLSKDVRPEELLDVLLSYEKRKKYHVLKSGEFVTLAGNEQLDSLLDLTRSMDIDIK